MTAVRGPIRALPAWIVMIVAAGGAIAQDADSYVASGDAKRAAGDLAGAVADYSKAIELDPRNAPAYSSRGYAKKQQHDLDGAIADQTKAIAIDPRYADAFTWRGIARHEKHDFVGAIADFTKAIELDPKDPYSYVSRADSKKEAGDLDGAIADCGKALAVAPRYEYAYFVRALAREVKRDRAGAIADYAKAIETNPRYETAYYFRGIAEQAAGDVDAAIADWTTAVSIDPRDVDAQRRLGDARFAKGDFDGAAVAYTAAIDFGARGAEVHDRRGDARKAVGDVDGAIADWSAAIERAPLDAAAFEHRGLTRTAWIGCSTDALADLRMWEQLDAGDNAEYADLWIWIVRAGLGETEAACVELEEHLAKRRREKADDWYSKVAGFLSGGLSEVELLRLAASNDPKTSRERLCEATFYAGAARALRGERAAAVELFDRCIATEVKEFIEHDGAIGFRLRLVVGARARAVPADVRDFLGLGAGGVVLTDVRKDGPAARAGLQAKDVVVSVDGKPTSPLAWRRTLTAAAIGQSLKLGVVRAGKPMDVELKLGRWE